MSHAELHFATRGTADRPAVLFLHGFMGSSSDWEEIMVRLSSEFFCIGVDLPGHGRSVGLAGPYSIERLAEMLCDVLSGSGVERAHVVGYSMGGRAALYFAVSHPETCRRLVLESASPGLRTDEERVERRGLDEARAVRIETEDYLEFLEEWYRQPLFETYKRHAGLLERMIRSRSANSPRELARSLRDMGTGSQPSLWDRLDGIGLPVLAVAGALDGKYAETAERMAVLMPRARAEIVPGAGHNVHAEKPEAFAEMLTDFLKKPT